MRLRTALAAAFSCFAMAAVAQVANFGGNMVPNAPMCIIGPITPGNCTKWVTPFCIGDAGSPCGSGGGVTPCAGTGYDFTQACNSQYIAVL